MDVVVNLAFNYDDMSKFAESGKDERAAIDAMGSVLEPGKLLLVTSGTGLADGGPGHVRVETDPPATTLPRSPEGMARAVAGRGVRVAIVRLPQVHDTRKQGLVPFLTEVARQKAFRPTWATARTAGRRLRFQTWLTSTISLWSRPRRA